MIVRIAIFLLAALIGLGWAQVGQTPQGQAQSQQPPAPPPVQQQPVVQQLPPQQPSQQPIHQQPSIQQGHAPAQQVHQQSPGQAQPIQGQPVRSGQPQGQPAMAQPSHIQQGQAQGQPQRVPQQGQPVMAQPSHIQQGQAQGQPQRVPQQGQSQPQMGQPQQVKQPQMGQPQVGQPQMVQPQMGQPQMGQPQMGQPQRVPSGVPSKQGQQQFQQHPQAGQQFQPHPQAGQQFQQHPQQGQRLPPGVPPKQGQQHPQQFQQGHPQQFQQGHPQQFQQVHPQMQQMPPVQQQAMPVINHDAAYNPDAAVDDGGGWLDSAPGIAMEYKVHVDAGKEDCYWQYVHKGATFYMSAQVLKGGDGNIGIAVRQPNGKIVYPYQWKPTAEYEEDSAIGGYYSVCLDNQFGKFSAKMVNLYITTFRYDEWERFSEELKELDMSVSNFTETLTSVDKRVQVMRQFQQLTRGLESRDYNLLKANLSYVTNWSLVQCIVVIMCGLLQVYFVRRLFESPIPTKGKAQMRA